MSEIHSAVNVPCSALAFIVRLPLTVKRDIRHRFGDRVRAVRLEAGMTQEDLAHAAKLDRGHISNIECGRHHVSLDTIALLAKALKVTIPQLMPDR